MLGMFAAMIVSGYDTSAHRSRHRAAELADRRRRLDLAPIRQHHIAPVGLNRSSFFRHQLNVLPTNIR
jgi:hypothetical protein